MAEKEKIAALIPHGKSSAEKEPPSRRSSYSTATLVADEREGFPDLQSLAKPENEVARTESLLDLQQSRGNYYVQKAIAEYRQRTAIEPPGPKEVATTKLAVTPPPKANAETTQIPHKVDPVPEATKVVETKVNKTLPAQTMPPFEESPQHNMPQIGPAPAPAPPSKAEDDKSKADADKKPAVDPGAKDPKKEQADKLNAPQKKEEGPIHRAPRGEIIIEDKEGPPKQEPEIPRPFKVGIAAALARLMADPRSEADAVLKQVRDTAYNGALPGTFPDIGKSSLEELTASLKAELD